MHCKAMKPKKSHSKQHKSQAFVEMFLYKLSSFVSMNGLKPQDHG